MLIAASYAYPPLRHPRAIQVARLLAALPAEEIVVVCGEEADGGDASLVAAYPDEGRRVVRVPWSRRSLRWNAIRSRILSDRLVVPDHFRPWQRDAASEFRRLALPRSGDVLVTFGQPMSDHLLGLRLANPAGARWIAHFSDPWIDSPFFDRGGVARRLNARLERRVVEGADAVVFTSAETAALVMAKYAPTLGAKVHVLPHAHDETLYPDEAPPPHGIVVRYIGNLYGHRGPEPLLDALRVLAANDPQKLEGVRVEFVGGRQHPVPDSAFIDLPEGIVTFRDPVDYLESLALMRRSHLLLVLDAPGDRSVFLPSKLVDYLGARRPIVALSPEGPAAALTRRAGGWSADPGDAAASAAALGDALDAVRRRGPDTWVATDVVREYSAATIADRFSHLVDAVASGAAAGQAVNWAR